MNNLILNCQDLFLTYRAGPEELQVLTGVNLTIHAGEKIAVLGASGSGKTSLLQLLAGLSSPTSGTVTLLDNNLQSLSESKKNYIRNQHMGFVYQFHHLLPEFTALENTAIPLLLNKKFSIQQAKKTAIQTLDMVNLRDKISHKPAELSGGERQRVAIARAIVNTPDIVFLDEPTGNLDPTTARHIESVITSLSQHMNTGFVIVTHDAQLAKKTHKQYQLKNGLLLKK